MDFSKKPNLSPLRLNSDSKGRFGVFVLAFACAALFALFTRHAWEDYYITYRASKNLATGHGLVFNVGDRSFDDGSSCRARIGLTIVRSLTLIAP